MRSLLTATTVMGVLLMLAGATRAATPKGPLKVYILVGQSNMEGQARIETFDYIGYDPKTAPLLKQMRGPDGKPRVCEKVWISYLTGWKTLGEGFGKLTAGYGSRSNPAEDGGRIGPEFTFGLTMEQATDRPVLIIKTAWGGKSLHTDFRPPSAGPYELPKATRELWAKHPQGAHGIPKAEDQKKWQAEKDAQTGVYYRLMIDHVKKVLADPKRIVPGYDAKAGYEIAGFVWFQGWNDMCDRQTYPDSNKPGGYAMYSKLMADFIRDVRKDLNAPKMPFVIGVIGVDGDKATGGLANLRPAMAAPANMPEFKGNVAAVETAPFWDHAMAAVLPIKAKIDFRFESAHMIGKDGLMEPREPGIPGWEPLGTPRPQDRTWRFMSFDAQREADVMPATTKPYTQKRFRDVTLPAGLEKWYMPGFDDSSWKSGKAPIGKGDWKNSWHPGTTVKYNSAWGDGEFLLMRTTFNVDKMDYESYRISVLARQGFHIYLNGHEINTYIWWKDRPHYRPIVLTPEQARYIKKGANVLAAYANVHYDRRTSEPYASIDLAIEGITKEASHYVNSKEHMQRELDKVCTREQQRLAQGASNAGFHYLGSGKIMAQIGKAFAEAMLKMEKK